MKCLIFPGFFKFNTAEIYIYIYIKSDYRQTCTEMNEQNVEDERSADVSLLCYTLKNAYSKLRCQHTSCYLLL